MSSPSISPKSLPVPLCFSLAALWFGLTSREPSSLKSGWVEGGRLCRQVPEDGSSPWDRLCAQKAPVLVFGIY